MKILKTIISILGLAFTANAQTVFDSVVVENNLNLSVQTAGRVCTFDGSKNVSSSTMPASYLDATSSIQTQLNSKQAALGFTPENVANKSTNLISPDNIKYPTTLAVANAIAAIPTPAPTGVTSFNSRTGTVVSQTNDYLTSQVGESVNLYWTNARTLSSTLTGYTSGAGTITSSDSVLTAIQKLNGNDALSVPTTRTISTTAPLTGGGDLSANRTLDCNSASGSQKGCLLAADWTTFNNKQAALGFTPENVANKATTFGILSNTLYPSVLATSNYVVGLVNQYVRLDGSIPMTGQLILPTFKLKSGAHELVAEWNGSTTFAFTTADWLQFEGGDVLNFGSQQQMNFTTPLSVFNLDEFGGSALVTGSGRDISLQTSSGGATRITNLYIDDGSGPTIHQYIDVADNKVVIETGASAGVDVSNSNALLRLESGDAKLISSIYGNSFTVQGTGGIQGTSYNNIDINFQNSVSGNYFTVGGNGDNIFSSTGDTRISFGSSSGNGFDIVNDALGMSQIHFGTDGSAVFNSSGGTDFNLTSGQNFIFASGSSGYAEFDLDVIPKGDKIYRLGNSGNDWAEVYAASYLFNSSLVLDAQNRTLNDSSGVTVLNFSNSSTAVFSNDVQGSVARFNNLQLNGTVGDGLIELPSQASTPSAPTSGFIRYYSNNQNWPSWRDDSNRILTFSMGAISASSSVEITIPNATGTMALIQNSLTGSSTTAAPTVSAVNTGLGLKSNIASPTFTGTPAAPTASSGTNTTQLATTAFVTSANTNVKSRAHASSTTISGSLATVSWTTSDYNSGSALSGGTYTCATTGTYLVQARVAVSGTIALNSALNMQLQKNGTNYSEVTEYAGGAMTEQTASISDTVQCAATDTLRIQVSSSATLPAIVSSNTKNFFSITRVGN